MLLYALQFLRWHKTYLRPSAKCRMDNYLNFIKWIIWQRLNVFLVTCLKVHELLMPACRHDDLELVGTHPLYVTKEITFVKENRENITVNVVKKVMNYEWWVMSVWVGQGIGN